MQDAYATVDESMTVAEFCPGEANLTRGVHYCNLCTDREIAARQAKVNRIGSAEIRIFYKGKVYAAPDLIYHYVLDHNYLPPVEFIEAVQHGPRPDSNEYKELILNLGVDYYFDES